ncbi:MAG: type II toxin-antitoxin system VapC family toxin [Propionibacteriaceae bacterium]|nr:type II toxin-antitoxin system VapC family toxin [Propionibacteriaceae bacterium]
MIVVDASVVVDALTHRDHAPLRAELAAQRLHAPSLIDYEVASALRGLVLGKALKPQRAAEALGDFLDLGIRRHPQTRKLLATTWRVHNRLSAYDASYVAVADALSAPLWTLDPHLARAASGLVEVVTPRRSA